MEKFTPKNKSAEDIKFKKAVEKEERSNNTKKVVLGAALMASSIAQGMDDGNSTKEFSAIDSNQNTIEASTETNTEPDLDTTAYLFGANPEDKVGVLEDINPENPMDPEDGREGGIETFEKVFDAGFEMGKADLSIEQIAELKAEFVDFLDSLPQEVKDRINSGESKIVIEGSTSYHVIDKNVGTDSGSRGQVFDNETLAQYRAQEGVKALQDNVLDNVKGIDSATMETSTRQYTQEDADGVIEEGRRLRISIEDSIERSPASAVEEIIDQYEDLPDEIKKKIESSSKLETILNSDLVIIDSSGSMTEDAKEVYSFIKNVEDELGKEIAKKNLGGGNMEAHMRTLKASLSELEDNTTVTILTDEPDSSFNEVNAKDSRREIGLEKYEQLSNEVIEELKERNITVYIQVLNPDHTEGGYKQFSLTENPEVMIPLDKGGEFQRATDRIKAWFDSVPGEHMEAKQK